MTTQVLFFGQLTDITGTSSLKMEEATDTDQLKQALYSQFPGLAAKNFLVSVNQQVITDKTKLQPNSTVALLPPFSGG